jgi:hypothetical protein
LPYVRTVGLGVDDMTPRLYRATCNRGHDWVTVGQFGAVRARRNGRRVSVMAWRFDPDRCPMCGHAADVCVNARRVRRNP